MLKIYAMKADKEKKTNNKGKQNGVEVGAGACKWSTAYKAGGTNHAINKNISEAEHVENAVVQA